MYSNTILIQALKSLPDLVEAKFTQELSEIAVDRTLLAGKMVSAVIVDRLSADRVLATINGQSYNLRLPVSVEVGQTLQLEVVDNQPQLLFRLLPAQQGTSADAKNVDLSVTAKWLQSADATLGIKNPVRSDPIPLLQQPTGAPAQLADNLRSAVARSGIFYESHQALWVDGKFPLEALKQEPQANTRSPVTAVFDTSPRGPEPSQIAAMATGKGDVGPSQLSSMHSEASSLVQQQLAALAGSSIEWFGQAWPGQPLHLSIQRDKEPALFDDPATNGWRTHLTLNLPRLGKVDATLHFTHAGVRIVVDTEGPAALDAVRASGKDLIDTLDGLGIKVLGLGLQHG
jgi:hypothetical protein